MDEDVINHDKMLRAAVREHDAAVKEFCDVTKRITRCLGRGERPARELMSAEQAAVLRLENARALFTFGMFMRSYPQCGSGRRGSSHYGHTGRMH